MKLGFDDATLDQLMVTIFSMIGALLSTRDDADMPILVRVLNTVAGFVLASLCGFILLEAKFLPFFSSGAAYLVGSWGYHLMGAGLKAAKLMELDPLTFAGRVINLIWSWKLPSKNNGNQS